jgi:hypothetical protein
MIERMNWPESRNSELPSPFLRGRKERPLRITFHASGLVALPETETEALDALTELSYLPEVQALQTETGTFPRVEIGDFDIKADHTPVKVTYEDGSTVRTGIFFSPKQLAEIAAELVHEADLEDPKAKEMLNDLLVAQAHCALGQDILVTSSPRLLSNSNEFLVREANPRKPTETGRIVGLFLRCRNNYTYRANRKGRVAFDRGLFYWVLVRHRLPGMWRYFSACVESAKATSNEEILYLGQSILQRCVRAMQARDAIGEQFYCPQDNNTRDSMTYHFDYLTLLLVGALDAEARVARRACGISRPKERYASFRNPEYLEVLRHSAQQLYQLVSGEHFHDVMTLLYTLRNTIHGPSMPSIGYVRDFGEPEESRVAVPIRYQEALLEAAGRCGSVERWGLTNRPSGRMFVEPHTYSLMLVEECFNMINAIATATDVNALFPKGYPIPSLMNAAPDDDVFGEYIRKRLAILG